MTEISQKISELLSWPLDLAYRIGWGFTCLFGRPNSTLFYEDNEDSTIVMMTLPLFLFYFLCLMMLDYSSGKTIPEIYDDFSVIKILSLNAGGALFFLSLSSLIIISFCGHMISCSEIEDLNCRGIAAGWSTAYLCGCLTFCFLGTIFYLIVSVTAGVETRKIAGFVVSFATGMLHLYGGDRASRNFILDLQKKTRFDINIFGNQSRKFHVASLTRSIPISVSLIFFAMVSIYISNTEENSWIMCLIAIWKS